MSDFEQYWGQQVKRIERFLCHYLDAYFQLHSEILPTRLPEAIRYSVLNGGKRLRPLLVYATSEALSVPPGPIEAIAAAIELMHCYSLVHDDLPSMDNDDLRRGKPTCHRAFNEATAILVGDALQTLAFEILSDPEQCPVSPAQQVALIRILATAAGASGMVGGQALDIMTTGKPLSIDVLKNMHYKKTGALIRASVQLSAIAGGYTDPTRIASLSDFAIQIGLAFQIQDDILDLEGAAHTLGKTPGKDAEHEKMTFPHLLGLQAAKHYATGLYHEALASLSSLVNVEKEGLRLAQLAQFFVYRSY